MKKLALGALFVGLLAACGGGKKTSNTIVVVDSGGDTGPMVCNPLMQTGCQANEKCTWIVDATTPMYVGHIGCEPAGTAAVGQSCMFGAAGASGYDNCAKGAVCSAFSATTLGMTGVCKQICDNQGGSPMCDASHVCVTYSKLFSTGATTPAAAGVCDLACNPLDDNDFNGSATAPAKAGSACSTGGSNDYLRGCYGFPSFGTPPVTGWSCGGDGGYDASGSDLNFRDRIHCDTTTGCADTDGTIYVNSCNQGYLPLFYDMTGSTTVDCTALCKPLDCYDGSGGHCGTTNNNRLGASPHRCTAPDIGGSPDPLPKHEECEYLWNEEIDGSGNWLPSATSNTVGVCFDHAKFQYDPTGGNNPTITFPGCEELQLMGSGSDPSMPLTYFGAVNFGCVSTTTAGIGSGSAQGKLHIPQPAGITIDRPRTLYHRVMKAE